MNGSNPQRWIAQRVLILAIVVLGMSALSLAQSPDRPAEILDAYRAQRTTWFTNV